jgi:Leucine-rich repeat (LRR) protein
VTDLSPLAGLSSLERLTMSGTDIDDIDALSGIDGLQVTGGP